MSKFDDGPNIVISPQCHQCKNWNKDLTCKAFKKGIPMGVLTNTLDHKKPVEGDNGIMFEPISKESP